MPEDSEEINTEGTRTSLLTESERGLQPSTKPQKAKAQRGEPRKRKIIKRSSEDDYLSDDDQIAYDKARLQLEVLKMLQTAL